MRKYVAGNGQYVIYAKDQQEARQVISQELKRFDEIKSKMVSLLSEDGKAKQNFLKNTSKENLNIHFNDETSLIYDDPENATTKGEVRQRSFENGKFTYDLAYRYPDIQGHNADFRLAHEMGHLMLNPSNARMQTYDKKTDTRQISGLIRVPKGQEKNRRAYYGEQIQENAINLIASLAVRGGHSADDIMSGKVDVSEFNLYKKCDNLVKLLAVSMRNDFDNEMSFEQLVENKIDSFIEHSDGSKEPANTFFYGVLNDSSMIENEFDKYMGKGAWRDLDTFITNLHNPNVSKEQFDIVFKEAQGMITEFANTRMQEKYKEAVARDGRDVPNLENKISMIQEMTGVEQEKPQQATSRDNIIQFPKEYRINEFGEIIRPEQVQHIEIDKDIPVFTPPDETQQVEQYNEQNENKLTIRQKIAQFLQKNDMLMNIPFVDKFVHRQLDVLPQTTQETRNTSTQTVNRTRESFINELTNFGAYRNLPPIQRMSDPEKLAEMRRKMEQNQQANDDSERF
nr:MAG TPA: IrrE N-terminal-like domain [Caudoviricetes sp.]